MAIWSTAPFIPSGSAVFAKFPVEMISGLSEKAMDEVLDKFESKKHGSGGELVERGCGCYISGATYIVQASCSEIADVLYKMDKEDIGTLMIGCSPGSLVQLIHPWAILSDVPFRQGFRDFNARQFNAAISLEPVPDRIILRGQFYLSGVKDDPDINKPGIVQKVEMYKKNDPNAVNKKPKKQTDKQLSLSI